MTVVTAIRLTILIHYILAIVVLLFLHAANILESAVKMSQKIGW